MNVIYIPTLCLLALLLIAIRNARKHWNGGKCKDCDEPWQSFDTDSTGQVLFKCGCLPKWEI